MRNLKECIELFELSAPIEKSYAVYQMEQLREWRTAAEYWGKIGRKNEQAACKMLADAIERGDHFREKTKHLRDWVDETVSQGIMTQEQAVKQIYPELNRIYQDF
jgi:hypothetical protein